MNYPYSKGDKKVKWVSTQWLEDNMDTELMIFDVQPDVHDYIKEHIHGAFYLNEWFLREMQGHDPAKYIPSEAIEILFRKLGIRKDMPTLVYTGKGSYSKKGDGWGQTMAAYSMVRFGHENVYILDGGIDKWKKEERGLTKVFPSIEESGFEVNVHKEYYIEYEEFKNIKDNDNVVVLDARPFKYYAGPSLWSKEGHIPGAKSLQASALMNPKNRQLLKPMDEIESLIEEREVTSDKTIICYCGTGREATNLFLVFKWYLNYPDVRIYEGSITEWVQRNDNPTVTGPSPY
jgi:thiosulfate/3-mercaptopyruvate sulfurtransferase